MEENDMKKIVTLSAFLLLAAGWFFSYPCLMRWYEGFSCFSTLPDFTALHFHFPDDIFRYCGSFLLQFYAHPAAGAMIQALIPILTVLCLWIIIKRFFKDSDSLFWFAFLPLPYFVYLQLDDMTLAKSCMILAFMVLLAAIVVIVSLFFRMKNPLPKALRRPWILVVMPILAVFVSLYILQLGPLSRQHEAIARLEYHGERQEWGEIIKEVTPKEALQNEYKRKYVLLALSQTGQLADHAFRYGLTSEDDFFFKAADGPLSLNFNVLFYRSLEMDNAAVYYAYQHGQQSLPGISYKFLRTLADIYIENKDYALASKYVDILSHTCCHGDWVEERLPKLEAIRNSEPEYHIEGEPFTLDTFLTDMSALVTRYPYNKKFADYLLCSVLAQKDGNTFMSAFSIIAQTLYPEGKGIPRLYQEALLLVASHEPAILEKYHIDEKVWSDFNDFTAQMQSGKTNIAKRKYAGSYWAYIY
jgi:hypothetical protein